MTQFKVEVDQRPFQEVSKRVTQGIAQGNKISMAIKLSSYKIKTTLGRELPEEDIPEVKALVKQMASNHWLDEEDMEWCEKHQISF